MYSKCLSLKNLVARVYNGRESYESVRCMVVVKAAKVYGSHERYVFVKSYEVE